MKSRDRVEDLPVIKRKVTSNLERGAKTDRANTAICSKGIEEILS